jgi:hypothetical protein
VFSFGGSNSYSFGGGYNQYNQAMGGMYNPSFGYGNPIPQYFGPHALFWPVGIVNPGVMSTISGPQMWGGGLDSAVTDTGMMFRNPFTGEAPPFESGWGGYPNYGSPSSYAYGGWSGQMLDAYRMTHNGFGPGYGNIGGYGGSMGNVSPAYISPSAGLVNPYTGALNPAWSQFFGPLAGIADAIFRNMVLGGNK